MNKGARTRRFIIETAAGLINKKGMAGTAISDIMVATKLKKGGIYNNFDSKDEICVEAFNFLCNRLADGINDVMKHKVNSKDKIFALLDYYTGTLIDNDGGCPLLNFGVEADDTDSEFNNGVRDRILMLQNNFQTCIETGVVYGEFDSEINAAVFSARMISNLEGAIFMSRVLGDRRHAGYVTDQLKSELETYAL